MKRLALDLTLTKNNIEILLSERATNRTYGSHPMYYFVVPTLINIWWYKYDWIFFSVDTN